MKLLAIDAKNSTLKEVELTMQANTLYTYFDSILIDELLGLNEHVIYTSANALSEGGRAYFLGEQLLIGDALIAGRFGFEDQDATISKEELSSLMNYEVSDFYSQALALLATTDCNLYRHFEVLRDKERFELNIEWVLYTFNIADDKTRQYFINELQKVIQSDKNVMDYMQKMATLAMNVAQ